MNCSQLLKIFNELYNTLGIAMKDYNSTNFDNKANSVEKNLSQKGVSKDILKDLDSSRTLRLTRREEFISYDMTCGERRKEARRRE